MSQFFALGGQNIGASALVSVLPMNTTLLPDLLVLKCNDSNLEASPCPGQQVSNPIFHLMIALLCGLHEWNEKHLMSFLHLQ